MNLKNQEKLNSGYHKSMIFQKILLTMLIFHSLRDDMPTEETIEELVDRILNKNIGPDEINKRRPKPFRYLTDAEEIKTELGLSNKNPISIMKNPNDLESIDNQLFQMGIGGNIKEIENILNKYRISRKFK